MKKITIIFISVLMIFTSCPMDIPYDDIIENTETVEESKEDNSKNNTEEPSNKENDTENDGVEEGNSENTEIVEESKEDDSENKDVENKTWCEISEDTKILGLNYFVCVDNSQKKLSPSINDENEAKKVSFFIRDYVSKYIEIRVRYNNKKLNFSSVNNSYIITNVMKKRLYYKYHYRMEVNNNPSELRGLFYFFLNKGHPAFIKDVS